MRKWMRDRLQRRKKKSDKESQTAPPLQPAYFDQEEAPPADMDRSEPEAPSYSPSKTDLPPNVVEPVGKPAEPAPEPAKGEEGRRGRGRRRRGGRGRGGRGREKAVAQAFAPAATKAVTAEVSAEPVDEDIQPTQPEAEPFPPVPQAPAVPAALPAASPRPPKGLVVLAIGLPGSGKSTWFKRHNVTPLSSDMMRAILFDDVREQRFQDLVFSNLRSMLKARLIARRPTNYVDATNLTPHERQHWIKLAKDYNYQVHAVFFDVPLEVCIERHQRRDRVVPEDVMRRMAAKLKPPSFDEGFAKITVVKVKKKEQEHAAS
jgi:predicted kinase